MQFLIENAAVLISVLALLVAAAGQIVKLTKTPKDDEVVAKLEDLIKKAEVLVSKEKKV